MGTDQIIYYIVALILGMLMYHMLKNVCGCKTVEPLDLGKFLGDDLELYKKNLTPAGVLSDVKVVMDSPAWGLPVKAVVDTEVSAIVLPESEWSSP